VVFVFKTYFMISTPKTQVFGLQGDFCNKPVKKPKSDMSTANEQPICEEELEDSFWEKVEYCGYLRLTFHSHTAQGGFEVFANKAYASIVGLDHEEMVTRYVGMFSPPPEPGPIGCRNHVSLGFHLQNEQTRPGLAGHG
jgi:hypothetical protein